MDKFKAKIREDEKGLYIVVPKTMVKKYSWKENDIITLFLIRRGELK